MNRHSKGHDVTVFWCLNAASLTERFGCSEADLRCSLREGPSGTIERHGIHATTTHNDMQDGTATITTGRATPRGRTSDGVVRDEEAVPDVT